MRGPVPGQWLPTALGVVFSPQAITAQLRGKGQGTSPKASWHLTPEHLPVLERVWLRSDAPPGVYTLAGPAPHPLSRPSFQEGEGGNRRKLAACWGTDAPAGPRLRAQVVATEPWKPQ